VLVLTSLGAAERRRLRGRGSKPAAPEPEPVPVETSRVTLISAEQHASPEAARAWLKSVDGEEEAQEAIRTLNEILQAHRVALADPFIREVSREQALVTRVGIGEGEQVAHGRWADAIELPRPRGPRRRRSLALRPQERLAALLGGRDAALACEELTMRARHDLDAGRQREAALQLRVALEAALAELAPWAQRGDIAGRIESLRAERGPVGSAANAALEGGLDDETVAAVEQALVKVEAALRARTALGFD